MSFRESVNSYAVSTWWHKQQFRAAASVIKCWSQVSKRMINTQQLASREFSPNWSSSSYISLTPDAALVVNYASEQHLNSCFPANRSAWHPCTICLIWQNKWGEILEATFICTVTAVELTLNHEPAGQNPILRMCLQMCFPPSGPTAQA